MRGSIGALIVGAALLVLAPASANALATRANVAFMKPNQNPWGPGSEFRSSWEYSFGTGTHTIGIPDTDFSPTGIISGALGLPKIGFAEFGGSVSGSAALRMGYAVSGGKMNIKAPGVAEIDVHTVRDNVVAFGQSAATTTRFDAGLTRAFDLNYLQVGIGLGGGYGQFGAAVETFKDPTFQTAFPSASAWAGLDYNLTGNVGVTAGVLKIGGECYIKCVKAGIGINVADSLDLVSVGPGYAEILGVGSVNLNQNIGFSGGSAQISFPDVKVNGSLQADGRTLAGSNAKSVISLNANLEQLLPFIGPLIHQHIGPVNLQLLSISGGPSLDVYQDFRVRLIPEVTMRFSQQVAWVRNGVTSFVNEIRTAVGETIDWFPLLGTSNTINVQTSFTPKVQITNETGLQIGYHLDVKALGVDTPLVDLGPFNLGNVSGSLIRIPVFDGPAFVDTLADVNLPPVEYYIGGLAVALDQAAGFTIASISQLDPSSFRVAFNLSGTDQVYFADVAGRLEALGLGRNAGRALIADGDVVLQVPDLNSALTRYIPFNLGRFFCVGCNADLSSQFASASGFVEQDGERLYLPDLSNFRTDPFDPLDPFHRRGTRVVDSAGTGGTSDPLVELPAHAVPEPGTWALMIAGFGLAGTALRRRIRITALEGEFR